MRDVDAFGSDAIRQAVQPAVQPLVECAGRITGFDGRLFFGSANRDRGCRL